MAGDPLAGTTAEAIEDEFVAHGEEGLSARLAPALTGRPVLLVAALAARCWTSWRQR